MRDPRMVRIFRELGLEDLGRLEIGGVGLVRLGLRAGEIQRVEDLRFVVLRIALGERLVRLGPALLPRTLRAVRKVRVVRCDRFEVVAFALRLRADLSSLVDRRLSNLGALAEAPCPASGLDMRIDAMPQVAIAQSGSFFSTSRNACSPALYQNECSIATARERSAWTAGLQVLAKVTFPVGLRPCPGAAASSSRM